MTGSDAIWGALAIQGALVGLWLCWWLGFRWRSFLLLAASIALGGLLWRVVVDWSTPDPGWLHGLSLFLATLYGAVIVGSLCLLGLIVFHVRARRRQAAWVRSLLTERESGVDFVPADDAALERLEEVERVKYLPCPRREPGVAAHEDWQEAVGDPDATAVHLLVPQRARVRHDDDGVPRTGAPFDGVLLRRREGGGVTATPVSGSAFCRRVMAAMCSGAGSGTPA